MYLIAKDQNKSNSSYINIHIYSFFFLFFPPWLTLGRLWILNTEYSEYEPVKSELTLSSEEIHVVLELEFEHVVLTDIITWVGSVDIVAQ